jgi:hypothetical protein
MVLSAGKPEEGGWKSSTIATIRNNEGEWSVAD